MLTSIDFQFNGNKKWYDKIMLIKVKVFPASKDEA